MVVITDQNFLKWAPKLRQSLLDCQFIAIDFEFLGLDMSAISLHDTTENRYSLLRENVIKYRPCQLGISFFKQNRTGGYLADCYAIPLFQRFGEVSTNINFSSLRFLRNHKFDLNEVFTDGVEYCTRAEFRKFEKALKNGNALRLIGKELGGHIELLKVMLHEKVMQHQLRRQTLNTEEPLQQTPLVLDLETSVNLKLPGCTKSSLEMCLTVYELTKRFPQFQFTPDESNEVLTVSPLPDSINIEENEKSTRVQCLEAFEGIAAILEAAVWMRKPIVGHNSLLDFMYMYHYFFHRLPEKYVIFKEKLFKMFPTICDTKFLAQSLRVELVGVGDSLQKLGDFFGSEKSDAMVPPELRGFCEPWLNPMEEESEQAYHNAGFDAYVTGEVFLKMAHIFINRGEKKKNEVCKFKRMLQILRTSILSRLPFQLLDIGSCHLGAEDTKGSRPDVINVVRTDRQQIEPHEFLREEESLAHLMVQYQFDMELSKDNKTLLLATNTAGSYAFLCERYSKQENGLVLLDELEAGVKWTFEQRQTSWRSHKNAENGLIGHIQRRWSRYQVARMDQVLSD
ncbi:unnamed protein product [Caenorhabditis sp. 36 PRJEB53466]|nr:unnamed protein product [Caenorhabditis sp. 36 PRJEB53466]